MSDALSKTRAFVMQRISAMLAHPDGWGPPLTVELQLLTLVETLHALDGAPDDRIHGVTRRFAGFIRKRVPGPSVPLAERLDLENEASEEFVRILAQFMVAEQHLDAELQVLPVHFNGPPLTGISVPGAEA